MKKLNYVFAFVFVISLISCNQNKTAVDKAVAFETVDYNVLYVGINNIVKVAATGFGNGEISLENSRGYENLTITKNEDYFIVRMDSLPEEELFTLSAYITIDGEKQALGEKDFRFKELPVPVASYGGITSYLYTNKEEVKRINKIEAEIVNNTLEGLTTEIVKFNYMFIPRKGDPVNMRVIGNTIPCNIMQHFEEHHPKNGDKIVVTGIKYQTKYHEEIVDEGGCKPIVLDVSETFKGTKK